MEKLVEKWFDGKFEYWAQKDIFGSDIIPSFHYSIIPE